jgi:SAM-dependent methyltransferase
LTKLYSERADLYDRAFSWPIEDEVDWLVERLGDHCGSVLEPGCGPGRYLEAFARRGIDAVGIDSSPEMVDLARQRGTAVLADMAAFDLGRTFDGAICPVSTLALLGPAQTACHLACVAAHIRPGGRYLVQLAIRDPNDPGAAIHTSTWEAGGVRVEWSTEELDLERGVERQRSRIEMHGEDVFEEVHVVTAWTPNAWAAAVGASPFEPTAAYDGGQEGSPRVDRRSAGRLLWHELTILS